MPLGTIKTLTEKGFGFIETGKGDLFFHSRSVAGGATFDTLYRGQTVGYTEGRGPQGPRAENVKPIGARPAMGGLRLRPSVTASPAWAEGV